MNLDFDPQKNYYDILWVEEWATEDEIKKAYRKWAMKHHPDRNKNNKAAEEKFKEINEANEVLSNSWKRQQYDAYRKWWFWAWWFWWFQWWGFQGWWFQWWVDLGDLLWWFFGGWWWFWWWQRGGPQQGDDLMLQLTVSFEDSYHWLKKEISYWRMVKANWIDEKQCTTCWWRWVVAQQARTPFGVMQTQWACPDCEWAWKQYFKDGKRLSGWWLEKHSDSLTINIPAWIKSWSKMRYAGMGNDWLFGWPSWDLYIKILVKSSDNWKREWDNILVDATVSLFDAVLWGKVTVPHPDGDLTVSIPKWLQIWESIRVSWKWFGDKWLLKSKWDLIVKPKISIPQKLSKNDEKLRKELAWK